MRRRLAFLVLWTALASPALADTLIAPPAVERSGKIPLTYRLDHKATGHFTLALDWTDSLGRHVEHRAMPVSLTDATDIPLTLDATRAAAMRNTLHAQLMQNGAEIAQADAVFIAKPAPGWDDYHIMMWPDQDQARIGGLNALGIDGGKIFGSRTAVVDPAGFQRQIDPQLALDRRFFVENIATDFYAAYHYWTPAHPKAVNWRYTTLQQNYLKQPTNPTLLLRDPSLSDPVWIARIHDRLTQTVQALAPYRPYYYNLGDETGIADLAAAWDFDFSPASLSAFRVWLHSQYASLAALNAEWDSHFATWDAVLPPTTTAAMAASNANFASWNDFKAFMDSAFANALRAGTNAVHQADPTAKAAIEGAQIPGWGGYDYTKLSHAVDAMEIYDAGNNVEIAHALNPALTLLSTSFASGQDEQHRIWHELLQGERGLVIWDEDGSVVAPDGTPGPRGREESSIFNELRGGLGALLIASQTQPGPVGILYSPTSFRLRWMLDHRAAGDAWTQRGSEREGDDNATRLAIRRAATTLEHAGLQPSWLTPATLANGALRHGLRAVVLPDTLALSPQEAAEIRRFRADGGVVLADGTPGIFDQHGRHLPKPALDAAMLTPAADMPQALAQAKIAADFTLAKPDGQPVTDVDIRVLHDGGVTILGLQRDAGPDGIALQDEAAVLTLKQPAYLHNLRAAASADWQPTESLNLTLDPVVPTLLAIAPAPPAPVRIAAPAMLRAGETAELRFTTDGATGTTRVLHIDAIDPAGHVVPWYSGNLVMHGTKAAWNLPMAVSDMPGSWTLRVRDVLHGGVSSFTAMLSAPQRLAISP